MEKHPTKEIKTSKKKVFDVKKIMSANNEKIKLTNTKGRKLSSTMWLQRHFNDPLMQAKKKDNFLSRAAYKILEIDQKFNLFTSPQVVIDLGAAPGSWMQVAWQKISSKNSVLIGIDLLPIAFQEYLPSDHKNCIHFLQGDFTDIENQERIVSKMSNRMADLIMSDMAPNTTGSLSADHLLLISLLEDVLNFTCKNLSPKGSLVLKMFEGSDTKIFADELKKVFTKVSFFKPISSNKDSKEIYIIARLKKN